jgi:glycosyltransferase involved in cell wall biosynthesis
MRVAHFIQRYPPALGGSEAYFARLSRFLASQGDEVTVFTTNAVDLEAFWSRRGRCVAAGVNHEDRVEVHRYPLWRWPGRRYLLKALSFYPHRLWQCLTLPCNPVTPAMWRAAGHGDQPFDVVHAAAFPYAWPIVSARRLARRWRVPFLLTPFLHLGDPANTRDPTRRGHTSPALRWLLRQADAVFVQTPSERQVVRDLKVDASKIVLQGLGVETAECTGGDRAAARKAWGFGADEVVIGHLANNSWEKGTIDLLEAALALWRRGIPAAIVVAGPEMANFRAYWQDFSRRLPPAARVVRLGSLTEPHKRDFFAAIDVFALPSRSDSFGLVLLEAWANALPNIAYRAGGIADVIRHEQDGLLVPCGAIDNLTDALERLCVHAQDRQRLGRSGHERLRGEFRWEDKLGMVRNVYASLAGAGGRAGHLSSGDVFR